MELLSSGKQEWRAHGSEGGILGGMRSDRDQELDQMPRLQVTQFSGIAPREEFTIAQDPKRCIAERFREQSFLPRHSRGWGGMSDALLLWTMSFCCVGSVRGR